MSKVNLFHYATSELSQDAFICWLLAHGMEEHKVEDPLLCTCALDFIRRVPGLENAQQIDEIKQQYLNIDVLVIVGDMHVIIEDKTYTNLHDNQIDVYTNSLVKKGIPQSHIRTVFYKIVEQPNRERVDREYTRSDILDILRKYKACKNDIFQDYIWRTWSRSRLAQKDLSGSLSMHGDMTAHVVSLRACKIDRQSTMSRAGAT